MTPGSNPQDAPGKSRPILLLAALYDEMRPTIKRLSLRASPGRRGGLLVFRPREGKKEERPSLTGGARSARPRIAAVVAGPGPERVVEALRIHAAADSPGLVIHLGFAGGLDPALKPGRCLRIAAVKNDLGQVIALDRPVPRLLRPAQSVPAGPLLLTADRLVSSPDAKRSLFARHHASAVDMETYPAAEAAAELSLPFVALRAVSDGADSDLPAEVAGWVRPDGRNNLSAVLQWLLSHPTRLGVLLRLARASRVSRRNLAQAVEETIERSGTLL